MILGVCVRLREVGRSVSDCERLRMDPKITEFEHHSEEYQVLYQYSSEFCITPNTYYGTYCTYIL